MSHPQAIADRARDRGAARRVHRRGDDARRDAWRRCSPTTAFLPMSTIPTDFCSRRELPAHRRRVEVHRGVFEVGFLDTSPLAGSAPVQPGRPLTRHPRTRLWRKDDGDHGLVINGECARRST